MYIPPETAGPIDLLRQLAERLFLNSPFYRLLIVNVIFASIHRNAHANNISI